MVCPASYTAKWPNSLYPWLEPDSGKQTHLNCATSLLPLEDDAHIKGYLKRKGVIGRSIEGVLSSVSLVFYVMMDKYGVFSKLQRLVLHRVTATVVVSFAHLD